LCETNVLTVKQAAKKLGVDHRVIRKLCEQGRIQCIDVGTKSTHHVWLIHRDVLERRLGGKL